MQLIKRNLKKKGVTTAIIHCLSILVLSAIIIVTPLSFQSQTNSSKYSSNSKTNENNANDSQNSGFFSRLQTIWSNIW
jgi:hypothetical protein